MTQREHTPGPWAQKHRKWGDDAYRTQVFPVDDPDNTIATIHWHSVPTEKGFTTDREANARLIAAAPDMLEALRSLSDEVDRIGAALSAKGVGATSLGMKARKARAAIARATGEKP